MVDLRLGVTMVLPPQVATEAVSAAEALLRLARYPTGNPGWREYHGRFVSRYGSGAVVPVEQLVDPTAGLGFPRHYSQQGRPVPAAGMSRRDERLRRLAQQAALDSAREIVLDDDDIDALAVSGRDAVRSAPHVDLCVEIRAPTATALAEGAFMLAVTGIGPTAIATTGRFLDVVSNADRQRMVTLYGRLPVGVEGALPAQLSFPPNHPRVQNVVRAPLVLPHVISLGEHRAGVRGRIPVQDLAVTADNDRLYVVSLSRRRVVEPVLTHAAARHTMPALARLLCEIPRATSAAVAARRAGGPAISPRGNRRTVSAAGTLTSAWPTASPLSRVSSLPRRSPRDRSFWYMRDVIWPGRPAALRLPRPALRVPTTLAAGPRVDPNVCFGLVIAG
ncbi:MAG: lantibiotic dehydratase family protein [Pseudonocardiaceae bacterium]